MPNVMIAEDDLFMADMLADVLTGAGYEVCGIARTVEEGIELGERCKPDLAVLDVRLAAGGLGTEIAAGLDHATRPGILYATGNVGLQGLTRIDGEASLVKPYRPDDVVRALKIVEEISDTGDASGPFPKGFSKLETIRPGGSQSNFDQCAQIERLRRRQAALARFGGFALREPDLEKVLAEAVRICADGMEVPFCKICRYRAEENDLLVAAGVGWNQGIIGVVVSRVDETSPQGRAFTTGAAVICGDLQADNGFVLPSLYAEHGILSTVDVVIKKRGKPYGVLEIGSPIEHAYDDHDAGFLTDFATIMAEAIECSSRNSVLQAGVVRMREMVADRDRLLAAKNRVLDEKNALLDEKTRLLDDKNVLAQELQHRVRNNLQLIYGMVFRQLQATTDAAGKEGLGAIARRIMTLAQVYDYLLGAGLSRTIDFGGYLASLCSNIESLQSAQHPGVALVWHAERLVLDLDCVTALGLVISELISNGYEHAFPSGNGTITVSLSLGPARGEATIRLADDGVGFTPSGESKRHGIGLVKRLMQQVNGSAVLRADHGSEWTLRFPLSACALAAAS